jgi:hypothetical protein
MPHIGMNPAEEEHLLQNRRLGSQMLTIGWILLAAAIMAGMLFGFQSLREGSSLMLVGAAVLGVVGITLVAIGTGKKRQP